MYTSIHAWASPRYRFGIASHVNPRLTFTTRPDTGPGVSARGATAAQELTFGQTLVAGSATWRRTQTKWEGAS
jgi:hypothetical protein